MQKDIRVVSWLTVIKQVARCQDAHFHPTRPGEASNTMPYIFDEHTYQFQLAGFQCNKKLGPSNRTSPQQTRKLICPFPKEAQNVLASRKLSMTKCHRTTSRPQNNKETRIKVNGSGFQTIAKCFQ